MNTKSSIFLIASITAVFGMMMIPDNISAETNQNIITITPINEKISLQKTVTTMNIPEDNELPWGAVSGYATNYIEGFPVIIQIYQGEDPIHFSQADVEEDGSYEYKFRIKNLDSNTGEIVNVFEGDYTVNIFRVILNTNSLV